MSLQDLINNTSEASLLEAIDETNASLDDVNLSIMEGVEELLCEDNQVPEPEFVGADIEALQFFNQDNVSGVSDTDLNTQFHPDNTQAIGNGPGVGAKPIQPFVNNGLLGQLLGENNIGMDLDNPDTNIDIDTDDDNDYDNGSTAVDPSKLDGNGDLTLAEIDAMESDLDEDLDDLDL